MLDVKSTEWGYGLEMVGQEEKDTNNRSYASVLESEATLSEKKNIFSAH